VKLALNVRVKVVPLDVGGIAIGMTQLPALRAQTLASKTLNCDHAGPMFPVLTQGRPALAM
jgi:hypothetical protein